MVGCFQITYSWWQIKKQLDSEDIFARFLQVECAFHSMYMDPIEKELLASLVDVKTHPATIPFFSPVYGKLMPAGATTDGHYWWQNVRQAVLFSDAYIAALEAGHRTFLEVASHPVLSRYMEQTAQAARVSDRVCVVPTLRRVISDSDVT